MKLKSFVLINSINYKHFMNTQNFLWLKPKLIYIQLSQHNNNNEKSYFGNPHFNNIFINEKWKTIKLKMLFIIHRTCPPFQQHRQRQAIKIILENLLKYKLMSCCCCIVDASNLDWSDENSWCLSFFPFALLSWWEKLPENLCILSLSSLTLFCSLDDEIKGK